MTATINASTSAGVVTTADTSGILQLQTNGTAALTVDASQNVGIGTASPASKLTVNNATATDYVTLTTAGSTKGVLADEAGDLIIKSAASLLFQTNGAIRARLNTTGAFVLAGGTTTANGIGITFPATQSASTNANTLDDYEEGTWTPVLSGSGSITTQTGTGKYQKIGNMVYLNGVILVSNVGTVSGGGLVNGLPFTNSVQFSGCGAESAVNGKSLAIRMSSTGQTNFDMNYFDNSGSCNGITNGTNFIFSVYYQTSQ